VHSVNTLSYASPFKTTPQKRPSGLPYDKNDPRTWNNSQTINWLAAEYKKLYYKKLVAEHRAKENAAKLRGKRIRPLPDDVDVQTPLDLEKFCPEPMTARQLGRLYANEWIERSLGAQIVGDTLSSSSNDTKK
jgi:kinesin family member 2/24